VSATAKVVDDASVNTVKPNVAEASNAATATVTDISSVAKSSNTGAGNSNDGAAQNNLIKRTVDEIYALMSEVHQIREDLFAHGIQFHRLNAMIELGVQDKTDELDKALTAAIEASVSEHGPQAIERDELVTLLDEVVVLEKDLRHVRQVARRQGVHMQALNSLTQLMRLNPGDQGTTAINTFLAYADAAGISLDRLDDIRAQFKDEPKSVLPDVDQEDVSTQHEALFDVGKNILLGIGLTAIMMWLVL